MAIITFAGSVPPWSLASLDANFAYLIGAPTIAGPVTLGAGTVVAPSLTFGSATTGLYATGTDELAITTAGSLFVGIKRMWTAGDYGFGINTGSPTARLHITGSGGIDSTLRLEATGSSNASFLHMKSSAAFPGYAWVGDTDDTYYLRHYSAYAVNAGTGAVTYTATFPFFIGAGNQTILGGTSTSQPITTGMAAGDVGLASAATLLIANTAGNNFLKIASLDSGDNLHIAQQNNMVVGFGGVANAALATGTAGEVMLQNTHALRSSNAANTGSLRLVESNASNRVLLDGGGVGVQLGLALIALGGGASATLGTIGGSGPATAAQNTWMKFFDSAGNGFWVPAWK